MGDKEFNERANISFANRRVWKLLSECFSLFLGSFLMIYIANVPKYTIDEYMNETIQACFKYIFIMRRKKIGSFLAVSRYFSVVITIIRKQQWLLLGYILAAVVAFVTSKSLTFARGIEGK